MKKHILTAAMAICGLALISCSNDSSSSDPTQDTTATTGSGKYTESAVSLLKSVYECEWSGGRDLTTANSVTTYGEAGAFDSYIEITHSSESDVYTHRFYIYNTLEHDDTNQCIIGSGVHTINNGNYMKTIREWEFDSAKTKAEADAYINTNLPTLERIEKYTDATFTKDTMKVMFYPYRDYIVESYSTSEYNLSVAVTGGKIIEKHTKYLPYNLKWSENATDVIAAYDNLVTNNKVKIKNYKNEDVEFDFPVKAEYTETIQKTGSGNDYDYERVKKNTFQAIYTIGDTTIANNYQYNESRYYQYEFIWNKALYSSKYIQQNCWETDEDWDIFERNSTMITGFEKYGTKYYPSIYSWLNDNLETNYYRQLHYSQAVDINGNQIPDTYYLSRHEYYESDSTSKYPTHLEKVYMYHEDYDSNGKLFRNVSFYSNTDSAYGTTISIAGGDVDLTNSTSRSISVSAAKKIFSFLEEPSIKLNPSSQGRALR